MGEPAEITEEELAAIEAEVERRRAPGPSYSSNVHLPREAIASLVAALRSARQTLWDIAGIAGEDLDGDSTPGALVSPAVEEFATEAVRSLRAHADVDSEFLHAAHVLLVDCATHLQQGAQLEEDVAAWRQTMQHTLPTADDVRGILAHPIAEEPTELGGTSGEPR